MKKIPIYLYLLIFLLIPHIRWISPLCSNQLVYGMPVYAGIVFCLLSPLLFYHLPRSGLLIFLGVITLFIILLSPDLNSLYMLAGGYVMFSLIGMPIVGLGAPLVLAKMENPHFARRVLTVLALACLLQTGFMCIESVHPDALLFVRPNVEGSSMEWAFTNRFGSNRTMYTLTDPMSAGAWAWFTGLTLIVLSPLAKFRGWRRFQFPLVGTMSLASITLTFSRGPAVVTLLSFAALVPSVLYTARRRLIAAIGALGLICSLAISLSVLALMNSQLFDSVRDLTSVAFSPNEEGNSSRIDEWNEGKKVFSHLRWNGAGLHTISFLWVNQEIDFENTFLTLIYATGIPGVAYSLILVVTLLTQALRFGWNVYIMKDARPQNLLCLSWSAGWLPFMFVFPCLRGVDCSFITFSILGSVIFFLSPRPGSSVMTGNRLHRAKPSAAATSRFYLRESR